HLARGEMAARELVARGQEVEIAVALRDELATEAPVERLEMVLRVRDECVPVAVVAVDVPAPAQREVHGREHGIVDHRLDAGEARAHATAPPVRASVSSPRSRARRSRGPRAVAGRDAAWRAVPRPR